MTSPPLPLSPSPTLLAAGLIYWITNLAASAADLAPSWTALPDETVLMVRVPGGEAFLDVLRKQTKLGAVVLSHDRLERVATAIIEQSPETWDKVREELGRVDLKPEDWRGLFRSDLGIALAMEPRDDRTPLFVLLGWLEPGEELAPRLMAALQSALSDQPEGPYAVKRTDIELAGHEVEYGKRGQCHHAYYGAPYDQDQPG